MAIDTTQIKQLRELTGAGISDAKEALEESNGDIDKAIEFLRKKGTTKAAKKMDRNAGEGLVESYIHANGKLGVLVEVRCETDFVARNSDFKDLAHDIAMQIAGANPLYVKAEDVPAEALEKEKDVYRELLKNEGKPADMVEKIVEGKINKYYEDVCLLNQKFIKDDSKTIEQVLTEAIAKLGEKIEVTRFVRYQI